MQIQEKLLIFIFFVNLGKEKKRNLCQNQLNGLYLFQIDLDISQFFCISKSRFMNLVAELVLKNTKVFEECAMSQNPQRYIESLPDSYEKKLLSFILNDHTVNFQEKSKEISLPYSLKTKIQHLKIAKKIQKSNNIEEVKYLLKDVIQESKEMASKFSKPAQFHSYQGEEGKDERRLSSKIEEKTNICDIILAKLKQSQSYFRSLTDYGIKSLPQEYLFKMSLNNKNLFLDRKNLIKTYTPQFLSKFLVQYREQQRKKNQKFDFSEQIFSHLSLEHLKELEKIMPQIIHNENFLSTLFHLKYSEKLQSLSDRQLTLSEQEQKKSLLEELLQEVKNLRTGKLVDFKDKVLKEILLLDLKMNNVKENLFISFIEKHDSRYSSQAHRYNLRGVDKPKDQAIIHIYFESEHMNNNELVEKYLQKLCLMSHDRNIITRLSKYFKEEKVLKIYARIKLKQGQQILDLDKILSQNEIRELKQSKQITILEKTKKTFEIDEDVILNIRVKNVKAIKLKIYEVDLETHYIKDGEEINPKQNLSFLNPTFVDDCEADSSNPFKQNYLELNVERIQKKRGVYIVELEGEGISSRAFIKKGAIASSERITSAGTQIKFEDEKGRPLKDLTVWLGDKKTVVLESYIIPFGKNAQSHQILVMKDNFYEKFEVYVPSEKYSMKIGYIFGSQSFIVGNKAKIILHPRLYLDSGERLQVSLELLKEIKIKVDMLNSQDIKSNVEFDKVEFVHDKDYVLEIPIQSHLKSINICIEANVTKYTGEKVELRDINSIKIDLEEDSVNFIDFYLKNVDSQFYLFALGKNGEEIKNFDIRVQQKLLGIRETIMHQLMTDQNGKVNLGSLESTEKIQVFGSSQRKQIGREWVFINQSNEVSSVENMIYEEGKTINIPYGTNKLNDLFLLRKNSSGLFISNQTKNCNLVDSRLVMDNLPQGKYELYRLSTESVLNFEVMKSDKWEKPNQIYSKKQNTIYKIPQNASHQICLNNAKIQEENDQNIIVIPLNSGDLKLGEKVRGHLYASNFMQPTTSSNFNFDEFREVKHVEPKTFMMPQCQYFSNKTLGQEASYVLNREKEKHQIGNNLQKPKIFLKNVQLRETNQDEEGLQGGQDYEQGGGGGGMPRNAKKAAARGYVGGGGKKHGGLVMTINKSLTSHNNFMQYSAWVGCNEKGEFLEFRVPKQYSHFKLFVLSETNALSKQFRKGDLTMKVKNISHSGMKDESKESSWTMSREVYPVQAGEEIKVGRSSTWCTVSLANIVNFARIKGVSLEEWVSNWQIYSQKEKENVYDKKVCHELNCYIKHHDKPFFQKVVRPFIQNKIKKTFVDFYLLDSKQCQKWIKISEYRNLNAFEKVLLVRYLMEHQMKEEAKEIAKAMENESVKMKMNFEKFKNQFQTVIYAKMVESASIKVHERELRQEEQRMMKGRMSRKCYAMEAQQMMCMQAQCAYEEQCEAMDRFCDYEEDSCKSYASLRGKHRQGFKQMEKTKEYGEKTYQGVKYEAESKDFVRLSRFWAAAAQFFSSQNKKGEYVDKTFMYLTTKAEFTLASTFLPKVKNAQFDLRTAGDSYLIKAESPFLVFVKELKSIAFEKKFGVFLNQRFFNPEDKYKVEEDGTQIEKQVEEFIICRPYCLQTLITNTSGTHLQLQLLMDLPQGSVPLKTHEYTKIVNINLRPYTTMSFERFFYFPREGTYQLYPANVCRVNQIIAKAEEVEKIVVKLHESRSGKMESFADVMRSGDQEAILQYVAEKNIHDQKLFDPHSILWMLKDKSFYERLMAILKKRKYVNQQVAILAFIHDDLSTIQEITPIAQKVEEELPIFEYFPYYSSRVHMFLNENKSKIRNVQFKNSYLNLLFLTILNNENSSRFKITLVYYLLLQDRIEEAQDFFNNRISLEEKRSHQLQTDYIQCFIDMYKGYPNFERARKIAPTYEEYPVSSWKKLFQQINKTLKEHDGETIFDDESEKKVYQTTYICEEERLRINIPEGVAVKVNVYDINLEMYFSEFPFENLQQFGSSIKASDIIQINAGEAREESIKRKDEWRNPLIELMLQDSQGKKSKLGSFLWSNPKLKVKVREQEAQIQVIYEGKRLSGCYCKVYQMKNGSAKFYRDGYTDITGTFKYVLAGLEGVSEFSILVESQFGGRTYKVKPPSQQGYLE